MNPPKPRFAVDVVGRICTGCGTCMEVCPESVFSIDRNRAYAHMPDECTGCRVCVEKCSTSAITVKPKDGKSTKK
jgi:NAD-dependent dihydropyrimidine dehydrogenase PreA subunit